MANKSIPFIFFGTPQLAIYVLEELEAGGFTPAAVVTAPDRPAGRGMKLTPPPVKVWAQKRNIPVLQPDTLDSDFQKTLHAQYSIHPALFIVAAYGKIIPASILDIPEHGTLNVHPSLLPKYRGPSPIEAAILNWDEKTGVTIMEMDEKMDHGPILAQQVFEIANHKSEAQNQNAQIPTREELAETLFRMGGQMLVNLIPQWIAGEIKSEPQDHEKATYTKKLAKADGLIDLDGDPEINWRKFCAYTPWPGSFFFLEKSADSRRQNPSTTMATGHGAERRGKTRVKITDAALENGNFVIKKVVPENGKEISWEEYTERLRGSKD